MTPALALFLPALTKTVSDGLAAIKALRHRPWIGARVARSGLMQVAFGFDFSVPKTGNWVVRVGSKDLPTGTGSPVKDAIWRRGAVGQRPKMMRINPASYNM